MTEDTGFNIDRASLADKSTRIDETTLFWPPSISFGYQINGKQNSAEITIVIRQLMAFIIVKQQV